MEALVIDFLQALAAGLLVGGTYGLMCVGLGIIFGVMRVVNFAHGDFMMLGMYFAFYLVTGFGVLAFLGPYPAAMLLSTALMLEHGLERPAEAKALAGAVDVAVHETPTPDLGGRATTSEFADAVLMALSGEGSPRAAEGT